VTHGAVSLMHPLARTSLRGAICATLLLTQLTACMTWRPVPVARDQQAAAEPFGRARLRLRSGAELTLRDMTVRGDSAIGFTENPRERRALPIGDVASIERRQLSAGRTAGVVVGAVAVTTIVAFGLAIRDLGNSINAVPAPRVP
jgi:hypothetical protein